jgi:hypothetical protein
MAFQIYVIKYLCPITSVNPSATTIRITSYLKAEGQDEKKSCHAELVSAPHMTSGLLGVRPA